VSSSEQSALVVWTEKELEDIRETAQTLVRDPSKLRDYAAAEFAEHTLLLGEVAKKFLRDAALEVKPQDASTLATAGGRLHGEWREMMLPMIKRLMKDGKLKTDEGDTGTPE